MYNHKSSEMIPKYILNAFGDTMVYYITYMVIIYRCSRGQGRVALPTFPLMFADFLQSAKYL